MKHNAGAFKSLKARAAQIKASRHKVSKPVKKAIKYMINKNRELNYIRNLGSATTYQNPNAINTWEGFGNDPTASMVAIAQGDTVIARDGDKVKCEYIRGTVNLCLPEEDKALADVGSLANNYIARHMILQCKRGFTSTQVIAVFNNLPITTDTPIRGNVDVEQVCYVLHDKTSVFKPDAETFADATRVYRRAMTLMYHFSIKPKVEILEWKPATTTGVAPDVRGNIFSIWYYTETDPAAALAYASTVRYKMSYDIKFRDI